MKNDSPITHRRNGFRDRLSAFVHRMLCAGCRRSTAEWSRLSRDIERLEDEQFPTSLDEKLIADAMTASAEARQSNAHARSRASEALVLKRALYAAVAVAFLVLTGLSVYPRLQPESALAQSAMAMSRIESAHAVGWSMTPSGDKKRLEYWIKGSKTRMFCEGLYEGASDGEVTTELRLLGPKPRVTILLTKNVTPDFTMSMFHGPEAVDEAVKNYDAEYIGIKHTTLPDGTRALVTEVRGRTKKWLIYINPATDLVVRWESYTDGKLLECIETFEYNIPIPDSAFKVRIPKDADVKDLTASSSPDKKAWRHEKGNELYQAGAEIVASIPSGEETSPFHPDYTFKCASGDVLRVYYVPDENTYWVLGKAEVTGPDGFSKVVEDDSIQLPGEPQVHEIVMDKGKPGAFCDAKKAMIGGYECVRFVNAGKEPLTIKWDTARSRFIIEGTARLLPRGDILTDQMVQFYADELARIEKPVWTGLPADEAAVAQEEFDILKRRTALVKRDPNMTGDEYINGGKIELDGNGLAGTRMGHYKTGYGLSIERVTKATPYIFIVPSQKRYYVVGTAAVKVKGQPDRMVKNGIVGFDGKISESE